MAMPLHQQAQNQALLQQQQQQQAANQVIAQQVPNPALNQTQAPPAPQQPQPQPQVPQAPQPQLAAPQSIPQNVIQQTQQSPQQAPSAQQQQASIQQPQQQQVQQQQPQQQQAQQQKKGVSFGSLMPYLTNLVSPEQTVKVTALYRRMKSNEISRQDFVRGARVIAGERVIMEALNRMTAGLPPPPPQTQAQPPQPQQQQQQQQQQQPQPQAQQHPSSSEVTSEIESKNKRPAPVEPAVQASPSGKKQKVDPVQSLEQINDVTAVGGVNLKEEEERMLTAPREESRTTAEMRRRFMEEDGRFFLEKGPLHSKVQEIAAKAGLKSISEDVEKCLSMSVEEWLWNFLRKSIRASKQRSDFEKDKHKMLMNPDIQKQVTAMRKEQREFRQRKAEEEERKRKLEEEKAAGVEEKQEGAAKTPKTQQQDEKLRTNAANIAARKAVGADDVMAKWMLMHAQQQQQQQKSTDSAWGAQRFQDQAGSPGGKGFGGSTPRSNARRPATTSRPRSIMLKDLVACLEREPGMCKSPLLYRLYEKLPSEVSPP